MASWKGFWDGFAHAAAKVAVWAASHPQVVIDVAQAAIEKNPTPLTKIPGDLSK